MIWRGGWWLVDGAVAVKTICIYNGAMKLLNVRLNDEDARIADHLRRAGVEISSLVREALRAEYARRKNGRKDRRPASEILSEIYARNPAPPDDPARDYDVHDRNQAREAILRKLKRGRA
jgi:hypothetical protein